MFRFTGGLLTGSLGVGAICLLSEGKPPEAVDHPDRVALCRMASEVSAAKADALAARTLAAESFALAVRLRGRDVLDLDGLPNGALEIERIPPQNVPTKPAGE